MLLLVISELGMSAGRLISIRFSASKALDVDDVGVTLRPAFDRVLLLVPHPLIEPWGLETVCGDNNLSAAASDSLSFGRAKQYCSQALSPVPFVHPDMGKLATSSPRMSVEPGDDLARMIANAAAEQHSVEVSGRLRVEVVDAIGQE